MKVVITGATGFIGSHLLDKLLENDADVTCLVRPHSSLKWLEGKRCKIEKVDFFNEDSISPCLADAELVFHIAGVIRGRTNEEYYQGNHVTTRNLVQWTLKYAPRIKRFVHFSSLAVPGPSRCSTPVDENSPLRPVSIYGESKMLGEKEVMAMKDKLPVTVVRPPVVYGIRDSALEVFYKLVARGVLPLIGSKKFLSVVHVEDLVAGTLRLLESDRSCGEIYFISDPISYTYEDMGDAVARSLGTKYPFRIRVSDGVVLGLGAFFTEVLKPIGINSIFSKDKAVEMCQKYWICTSRKIEDHFGFKTKIDLKRGMTDTIRWYQDQGSIPR